MEKVKRINNDDLYMLAEREGISILTFPMPECTAITIPDSEDTFAIGMDPSVAEDSKTEKTVISHELGHCMTGAIYTRHQDKFHKAKAEYSATKWAVQTLIDRNEFISLLKKGYRVWELADEYNVSEDLIRDAYHFYCELEVH